MLYVLIYLPMCYLWYTYLCATYVLPMCYLCYLYVLPVLLICLGEAAPHVGLWNLRKEGPFKSKGHEVAWERIKINRPEHTKKIVFNSLCELVVWTRCVKSLWNRCEIGVKSLWNRYEIVVNSLWTCCEIVANSLWDRCELVVGFFYH